MNQMRRLGFTLNDLAGLAMNRSVDAGDRDALMLVQKDDTPPLFVKLVLPVPRASPENAADLHFESYVFWRLGEFNSREWRIVFFWVTDRYFFQGAPLTISEQSQGRVGVSDG